MSLPADGKKNHSFVYKPFSDMQTAQPVYTTFCENKQKGKKTFAVLIDPDNIDLPRLNHLIQLAEEAQVDYLLIGGSLVITDHLDTYCKHIKQHTHIPLILFPGSPAQLSRHVDALLYLSLISGRNAELLIGQHVLSAAAVKQSGVEVISTGYMVIDGGVPTTVSYISNAAPIPADKDDIAMCTALAGEMLGKKIIYMDAGSGARYPISERMLRRVAEQISLPLIAGGGIRDPETAYRMARAGADVIVVGNAIEKDPELIRDMATAIHSVPAMMS
ncbi:putative glycerol-1-phosphate prenyltransferase [Thermoflavifilum aggregans]|uniref:Geranylgeranylglyceryl phosphate synthase n=1 Tax=Thermoflavifilum aggregans TaxID=454188 RepID=A0A2M9CT64_9BACT|nr:geranylgeranylglyceryl/heptaprenylglyceryl phosphate synthase [Thermoflavifilum aggregans]PJJ75008.1 putative glycerol-1-phosphate prenyltransferase [Thermoflavifilum aggregans]